MDVAFRADASLDIGTGHVMRCLALADALTRQGARCTFLCRRQAGHLIDHVRACGHAVKVLEGSSDAPIADSTLCSHPAAWLGTNPMADAAQTRAELSQAPADWLVVDHYGLDAAWERHVWADCCRHLLCIDDLADRSHICDVLLDQNLGRTREDYAGLVPPRCELLIGPAHALLRPEFAEMRITSLHRRQTAPAAAHWLITLGGVDKHNATGAVLQALKGCALPAHGTVTVVMGPAAPWVQAVRQAAAQLPWHVDVRSNVRDMAQLMHDSDVCIGAAGSTSWERCVLGLPSLMVTLADNQRQVASSLHASMAAIDVGTPDSPGFAQRLRTHVDHLCCEPSLVAKMSSRAAEITRGLGARELATMMFDRFLGRGPIVSLEKT